MLKIAEMTIVPKPGKPPYEAFGYRPISFLPEIKNYTKRSSTTDKINANVMYSKCILKIFETIVFNLAAKD